LGKLEPGGDVLLGERHGLLAHVLGAGLSYAGLPLQGSDGLLGGGHVAVESLSGLLNASAFHWGFRSSTSGPLPFPRPFVGLVGTPNVASTQGEVTALAGPRWRRAATLFAPLRASF